MRFWKYHGLGNDFIIMDNMDLRTAIDACKAEALCNRRFGIGADGVILVEPSLSADVKMVIYNSDGSRAEMCGNGIRCFAKFVHDKAIVNKSIIAVETDAGLMNIQLNIENGKAASAVVNMGRPEFAAEKVPMVIDKPEAINYEIEVEGNRFKATSMLMGVPHTVVFVDGVKDDMVQNVGKQIENSRYFPKKTNVNFVKVIDRENIILRTWERGAGYTYACGTGACASVAAAIVSGLTEDRVKVQLRGGELIIHWKNREFIFMEGPAAEVFEGNYENC